MVYEHSMNSGVEWGPGDKTNADDYPIYAQLMHNGVEWGPPSREKKMSPRAYMRIQWAAHGIFLLDMARIADAMIFDELMARRTLEAASTLVSAKGAQQMANGVATVWRGACHVHSSSSHAWHGDSVRSIPCLHRRAGAM